MWALDGAKLPLEQFEAKDPDERKPKTCLELCEAWASYLRNDISPNKARLLSEKQR